MFFNQSILKLKPYYYTKQYIARSYFILHLKLFWHLFNYHSFPNYAFTVGEATEVEGIIQVSISIYRVFFSL